MHIFKLLYLLFKKTNNKNTYLPDVKAETKHVGTGENLQISRNTQELIGMV